MLNWFSKKQNTAKEEQPISRNQDGLEEKLKVSDDYLSKKVYYRNIRFSADVIKTAIEKFNSFAELHHKNEELDLQLSLQNKNEQWS